MRTLLALLTGLTLLSCQPTRESTDSFASSADAVFLNHPEFAGVVLVADQGRPIYFRAFGQRDQERGLNNDTTTVFELASVSKQFTSMIIMMLMEEGKLTYEDSLGNYIPGLPYPGITIRHLLTHTSGLPDYQAVMDEHWDKNQVAGNADIIAYLKKYHPVRRFAPGERYEYSNTGYVMLGSIAEAASGQDFIALCRDRIFKPVGMTATDIRTLEEKAAVENFAKGYVYIPDSGRYVPADRFPSSNYIVWLGNRKGPGRVSSTGADLLKWDRALYNASLIKKETLEEAFTPFRLNNDSLSRYGFGWVLQEHPTLGRKIWHTGSNPGYSTRIVRFVDANKTYIVLSNNAYPKITMLDIALDSLLSLRVAAGQAH